MKLQSITVNNFLPFDGEYTLDFTGIKAATVSGPNETGKSSLIIDAILFALFGKARKKPDGLINDLSDSGGVTLCFDHQNTRYKAIRQVKRGKNQTLKLTKDGQDISDRLLTTTQKRLEDILGFSYSLLLSTSIAQQDEINTLSLIGATEREKILNEMIGNEHWEVKKKKVSDFLNEYKNLDSNIDSIKLDIAMLKQDIEEKSYRLEKITEEKVPLSTKLSLLEKEFEELQQQRNQYHEFLALQTEKNEIVSRGTYLNERIAEIEDKDFTKELVECDTKIFENTKLIDEIYECLTALSQSIKQINVEKIGLQANNQTTGILEQVPCKDLDIYNTCPLLEQSFKTQQIQKEYIAKYKTDSVDGVITVLNTIISNHEAEHATLTATLEDIKNTNTKLSYKKLDLENKAKQVSKRKEWEEELTALRKQYKELNDKSKDIKEFDTKRYDKVGVELNSLKVELAKLTSVEEETPKEIQLLQSYVTKKQEDLDNLLKVEKNIANYKTLYTAYNEIPTFLFEEAIPVIEQYTNEILQKVSPERRIELRSFKENKDKSSRKALDVISIQNSGVREFNDLSGSAKFRQSLALRIALARYNREMHNIDLDFFIVDEGFGSLDPQNVQIMKNTLKDIASNFGLFLMISHIEELNDVFDTQIIVNSSGKGERITVI